MSQTDMKSNVESDSMNIEEKKYCIDDFEILKLIGWGGFGKVYLGIDKEDGIKVAIKVCEKKHVVKKKMERALFYELYHHSQVNHPYITRLYTYFYNESNLYFILEYAENSSLFEKLKGSKYKRFDNCSAAKYIFQLADALKYCHDRGFLHGDLKPENVLVDIHGDAKLTDFGLSWPLDNFSLLDRGFYHGTLEYMAPELLNKNQYNETIDHWSIGVMCYEFLVGKTPFYNKQRRKLCDNILQIKISFTKIVPDSAKDLITNLLKMDPDSRLPLEDVINHKWISDTLDKKEEECLPTCPRLGEPESMEVSTEITLKPNEEVLSSNKVTPMIESLEEHVSDSARPKQGKKTEKEIH